jgi:phosphoribosylformimino-5-aminoimidazole carboxamide ribotide isomerase
MAAQEEEDDAPAARGTPESETPSTSVRARPDRTDREGPFLVAPAVDLLGTEAVRLEQGRYDSVRLRAGDPAELVSRFARVRPPFIHLVDLDGARSGQVRPALVESLVAAAAGVPVQASGGIRSLADAEALLAAGATRVVVGTAAFAEGGAAERFASSLQERLIVALDVRGGRIAVSGWRRDGGLPIAEAVARCVEAGVQRLHCTAIERDGTMQGPDLELLAFVRDRSGLPVLAAGGIRSPGDLDALTRLGLEGAIVGRALLEGTVPLSALGVVAGSR